MSESEMIRGHLPDVTSQATETYTSSRRVHPDEDQLMLDLAVEWLPFGGPKEQEIWVRFGVRPTHFWHRLCYLLTLRETVSILDDTVITKLKSQAATQFNRSNCFKFPPSSPKFTK